MADKDKKKLKVILKLPRSTPVPVPGAAGNVVGSGKLQNHHPPIPSSGKNHHHHHGVVLGSAGTRDASPSTPPKKRKFKAVVAGGVGEKVSVVADDGFTTDSSTFVKGEPGKNSGRATLPSLAPLPPSTMGPSQKKQDRLGGNLDTVTANAASVLHATAEPLANESLPRAILEGVLDKLQKKDTYGVFSEPVDAAQVTDYYDVIKEPMDFGTMRKKIENGFYNSMEVFEADIFLICSNAMRYNGPETIYYKQARAIRDMARRALDAVNVQIAGGDAARKPASKKKQSHAAKKRPPVNRARVEVGVADVTVGAADEDAGTWSKFSVNDFGKIKKGILLEKLVGVGEDSEGAWSVQSQALAMDIKADLQEEPLGAAFKQMGPRDGRRPLSTDEYHRNTYKPRMLPAHGQGPPLGAVGGETRLLLPVGIQTEHAYAKSLARFGANLGPSAWRFVARKLQKVLAPNVPFGPGWIGF